MQGTGIRIQIPTQMSNTYVATQTQQPFEYSENQLMQKVKSDQGRKYLITSDKDRLRFFEEWANSQLTIKEVSLTQRHFLRHN